MTEDLGGNLERFSGFADVYDAYRPTPPILIVDILTQLAEMERPDLVVDLGSGTGLSTAIWAGRAEQIVGVEPNADMRRQAEVRCAPLLHARTIRFEGGISSATGLPDTAADVVTVSQALHWMEPNATFAEAQRILRPGGVFAAYDCDWPPTLCWEAEAAFEAFMERGRKVGEERGIERQVRRWSKSQHLERMHLSGRFRYVKEVVIHSLESGDAERLVGVALSQGSIARLLLEGVSEEELGVDAFRTSVQRVIGEDMVAWYWSYRMRVGVV